MGRRAVSSKLVLSADVDGGTEEIGASSESRPQPVDLGDMAGLKRGLDDCALNAVLVAGYQEDHLTSNVKISIGSITVAVALIAQFYPKKHPDNWGVLLLCLVLYCIGSIFLSLFSVLYEEDACFITRPKKSAGDLALRVSSRLPRYSDRYTLTIFDQAKHKPNLANVWSSIPRKGGIEREWSLTQFYDLDGFLHEELFKAEIQKLVAQCERQHMKTIQASRT